VVIGLAAAGGTFAGGTLYSAGASTIFGAFLLPFVATSACTLSLVPLVWCALPSAKLEEDAGDGDEAATGGGDGGASLWGFSRLTTLTSTFAGSALIEAILPTIPPVLEDMGLDSAKIGFMLSLTAGAYMLGALGGGCVIDRWPGQTARRLVMGTGWMLMALSYATVGPLAAWPADRALGVSLVAVGMFVQGLGSGGIIVPSLPDAQAGLASESAKSVVCSVWNSCYSGGAAIGPIVASSLSSAFGFKAMCIAFAAWGSLVFICLAAAARGGSAEPDESVASAFVADSASLGERSSVGKPALCRHFSGTRSREGRVSREGCVPPT